MRVLSYTKEHMVDISLPAIEADPRPLRVLFLDLNAYFASVEQQASPELRGKPIVVSPVDTDTTVAIAASYEAKAYGIKTGTTIGEARRMCPDLQVISGRPPLYVHYHEKVIEAVNQVLPVDKVCSIDEMRCRLLGVEKEPENARKLALQIKQSIRDHAGECLKCSVGIAPNSFLAKLGTEMQKPDGLVILTKENLEERACQLDLTDFTGINRRMKARLQAAGIFCAKDMYARSASELRAAFGSILGQRWWYLLRGYELDLPESERKSLSHSHVLPPNLRTDEGCRKILMRLISKAAARLRSHDLTASEMSVFVQGFQRSWKAHTRLDPTHQSQVVLQEFERLWAGRDFDKPRTVGVVFSTLKPLAAVTPSLFEERRDTRKLDAAIDDVNKRFGKNSIYLAALEDVKDRATEKIAFDKTWLFSEGKDDNVWPDTFRGGAAEDP